MLKYDVVVYWSQEEGTFIAQVPELPWCVADGATKATALEAVEAMAKEWIETAKMVGRAIPRPRKRWVGG